MKSHGLSCEYMVVSSKMNAWKPNRLHLFFKGIFVYFAERRRRAKTARTIREIRATYNKHLLRDLGLSD